MASLIVATTLLLLCLIPLAGLIWMWRHSRHMGGLISSNEQETIVRIIDKGQVIGHVGEQLIFEWIDVETASGLITRLTTQKPSTVPAGSRLIRFEAGAVIYWGLAQDEAPTLFASSTPMERSPDLQGFSLVELMIVVVIIGILMTVTWPAYQRYVQQSAAKPVTAALLQLAQRLDAYAQDHDTYVGGCGSVPSVPNAVLSCLSLSSTDYTVQASGTGPISGLAYTLTRSGLRATPSAPRGWPTSSSCWIIDAQGDCA